MKDLYPYQVRVLEAILAGRNVILVIPTGGGKTLAASLPFCQSRLFGDDRLPGKALYAVPMRVLATQFQMTCEELFQEFDPDLLQELETTYKQFERDLLSIQTGESPQDPQFASMITACTIDQLLASALGVPYSLDKKCFNINVGAICSSYLILDEPHLYPLSQEGRSYKGAFTTCLEMLRLLKGITRFVFMSATMSSPLVCQLSKILDAEVITVTGAELDELNKKRVRTFERSPIILDAEAILKAHNGCSLVVCNTVQRAQQMYLKLHQTIEERNLDIELKLLHSRFTDEDRADQSRGLRALIGKEQWEKGSWSHQGEKSLIVIATQVVEVGLDISVQTLHTELSPANSLVQRAGRCARFEQQHGRVIVYPLGEDEQGQPVSSLPYDAKLCDATWQVLERYDGQVMGFEQEQELVDTVHTAGDLDLLARYEEHRGDLQETITKLLRTNERGDAEELIRDVTQVQLLIHNTPKETITTAPWRWQHFSLHPGLLHGKHWDHLKDRQAETGSDWMKGAVLAQAEEQPDDEEDSRQPSTYTWSDLTNPSEVPGTLMIAIPNQLATYDKKLGLVFLDGRLELPDAWQQKLMEQDYQSTLREREKPSSSERTTRMQHYRQHVGGLADAYHYGLRSELAYTMTCLEDLMGLQRGTIDHAIQLAIATHDLGKLDDKWQRWARGWQCLRSEKTNWSAHYKEPGERYFFAKTDYDFRSKEEREWQKELRDKRPPHACESVTVGRAMIAQSLGISGTGNPMLPVLRAICYAIAHHHTTSAHEYGATSISPAAVTAINKAIEYVRREGVWTYDLQKLDLSFAKGDLFPVSLSRGKFTQPDVTSDTEELLETWLAFLIVRALRIADQRADIYL